MYIFLRKTPLSAKKWGSPAVGRSQVGTAGIHTIGVPPDLLYFLASTSNTKRSSNSSISKERYNWRAKTEDGAAGSYSNPYTRDETGPVVPPCLENSTLTYIAQRPAHPHVSRRARARTLSPRSLPAAGASHALTQPANVFFLLRSASCVSGSNS